MRWSLLLLLLLAGCATSPALKSVDSAAALHAARAVMHFRLVGRMSVKTPDRFYSGTLSWTRTATGETLLLSGPLGQGAAEIRRQGDRLVLTTADGERIVEDSSEHLLERALGLRLPLSGLVYWLSGLPRPGTDFRAGVDGNDRVERLDQDGWHIEYERYRRYGTRWLPGRIIARRGDDLEFRFVLDDWKAL